MGKQTQQESDPEFVGEALQYLKQADKIADSHGLSASSLLRKASKKLEDKSEQLKGKNTIPDGPLEKITGNMQEVQLLVMRLRHDNNPLTEFDQDYRKAVNHVLKSADMNTSSVNRAIALESSLVNTPKQQQRSKIAKDESLRDCDESIKRAKYHTVPFDGSNVMGKNKLLLLKLKRKIADFLGIHADHISHEPDQHSYDKGQKHETHKPEQAKFAARIKEEREKSNSRQIIS